MDFARDIHTLSPAQHDALLKRLADDPAGASGTAAAPSGAISYAEERLWYLQQVAPESCAYNVAIAADIRGPLNLAALGRAVELVVERHEALRATFIARAGQPRRVMSSDARVALEVRETPHATYAEACAAIRALAERPFSLAAGPLVRVLAIRVGVAQTVVGLVTHHIVSDGWSLHILTRDLWAFYQAVATGVPARVRPLEAQYSHYADDQRRAWARPPQALLDYWQRELALAARLHFGSASRSIGGPRAAIHHFRIDADLVASLHGLVRTERATSFMVVAAAWAAALARYGGGQDFLLGFPVSNRPSEALEHVVGLFANTLVARVSPHRCSSGRELLRHTRQQILSALEHELPFGLLARQAPLGMHHGATPIVQAMCVVDDATGADAVEGLDIRPLSIETVDPKFDVSLIVTPDRRGFRGAFEIDTARVDRSRAGELAEDVMRVLSRMAMTPDASFHGGQSATVSGSQCRARPVSSAPVHQVIAAVAAARPEAIAVRCSQGTLTYAQLLQKAERVASYLQGIVTVGSRVGVCLPRSADAVVAVLAILRAGGAYVPLAPSDPPDRIRRIARDAGCKLVFTEAHRRVDLVPSTTLAQVLDAVPAAIPHRAVPFDPGQLAYVIYTSGTTGEPKGVMVSHRNLSASTEARVLEYDAPPERFLWASPLVFDSSVAGLFWTLCAGGTLVLPGERELMDPTRLRAIVHESSATHMLCLPSVHAALLRGGADALSSLRVVIVAGEPCPAELPAVHVRVLHRAALYNEYGPTEATVWTTVHKCSADEGMRVPIGHAIDGWTVRILDPLSRPLSSGGVGELCIGGAGVAQGYLGRPDLTAERFAPDPLGNGARLYRSGDLASERGDGCFDYHGRLDRQLKVRGVRVDPGEIEAHLAGHSQVRAAAVVGRSIGGHTAVVAYVARNANASIDASTLRAHLRERLPDAFTPAHYCFLDELPRTATGKVDLHALPEPVFERAVAGRPPATETERVVAAAWSSVFGMLSHGVNDNFFEVGGHSLLLMSLHAVLVERFAELLVLDLLEHPTIAGLASFLDGRARPEEHDTAATAGGRSRQGAETRRRRRQSAPLTD